MSRTLHNTLILAVMVCAGGLAAPAASMAANVYLSFDLPGKVHGYSVGGGAGWQRGDLSPSVGLGFTKTAGKSSQSHDYGRHKGFAFSAARNLSSARLNASFGRYGQVKLRFVASGPARGIKDPVLGCTGGGYSRRAGAVSGSVTLNTHSSLGTVRAKRMAASLTTFTNAKETCTSFQASYTYGISSDDPSRSASLHAFKFSPAPEFVVFHQDDANQTKPITISHSIRAFGGTFAASSDTSAHLVPPAGPFLSGSNDFEGGEACPGYANGNSSGTILAKFDLIGTLTFGGAARTDATSATLEAGPVGGCLPGGTGGGGGTGGTGGGPLQASPGCASDPDSLTVGCFDNSSGGTGPYTYLWDFGDGTTDTSANPSHTYATASTYTVTETVTDSKGAQSTQQTTVTVPSPG